MPNTLPPSRTLVNTFVWWAYVFLLAFRGFVVLIVCADLNSAGSVAKKALSSLSELALALSACCNLTDHIRLPIIHTKIHRIFTDTRDKNR